MAVVYIMDKRSAECIAFETVKRMVKRGASVPPTNGDKAP